MYSCPGSRASSWTTLSRKDCGTTYSWSGKNWAGFNRCISMSCLPRPHRPTAYHWKTCEWYQMISDRIPDMISHPKSDQISCIISYPIFDPISCVFSNFHAFWTPFFSERFAFNNSRTSTDFSWSLTNSAQSFWTYGIACAIPMWIHQLYLSNSKTCHRKEIKNRYWYRTWFQVWCPQWYLVWI